MAGGGRSIVITIIQRLPWEAKGGGGCAGCREFENFVLAPQPKFKFLQVIRVVS
jgi:hypothetical protein